MINKITQLLLLFYVLASVGLFLFLPRFIEDQTYIGIFSTFDVDPLHNDPTSYVYTIKDQFLFLDVKKDYDEFVMNIEKVNPTKKKLVLNSFIHEKNKTVYKPLQIEWIKDKIK
jgi:hypothetical protein